MKATGKKIWNSWNKFLLEELFLKSRKFILASKKRIFLPNVNLIKSSLFMSLNNRQGKCPKLGSKNKKWTTDNNSNSDPEPVFEETFLDQVEMAHTVT